VSLCSTEFGSHSGANSCGRVCRILYPTRYPLDSFFFIEHAGIMSDGLRYRIFFEICFQCNDSCTILCYRLRQSWHDALSEAESHFRHLLSSGSSREWKRVSTLVETSPITKGKARASANPGITDVVVHRKGDQIYRAVLDIPSGDELVSLESWKAVLSTPELRQVWDPAVEAAHLIEMFDPMTRVSKTNYTLGWPAKCVFHLEILFRCPDKCAAREMPSPSHVYSMTRPLS
jgi:hypothetical protein